MHYLATETTEGVIQAKIHGSYKVEGFLRKSQCQNYTWRMHRVYWTLNIKFYKSSEFITPYINILKQMHLNQMEN